MEIDALFERFDDRDWERPAEGSVRIAMVGLGGWTVDRAIPAVAAGDYCETTTLVSSSAGKAADVAADLPGGADAYETLSYEEFEDGAAADAYDAVYVATPNALHLPHVRTAAEGGADVLCEKPLEASVERAAELVDVCEEAGVTLMTGYRMMTSPALRLVRELVREGAIGEIGAIRGHMTQPVLAHGGPDQWRLDPELAGRGTSVTDLGIYPINAARFVLDEDPVSVRATTYSDHPAFDDVPDERAAFSLAFPGGVTADCVASQNLQRSGSFRVIGTAGELRLEPAFFEDDRRTLRFTKGSASATFTFDAVDGMAEEFDYFGNHLLTDRAVEPDGDYGETDLRIVEAVYDAAERDERVTLG